MREEMRRGVRVGIAVLVLTAGAKTTSAQLIIEKGDQPVPSTLTVGAMAGPSAIAESVSGGGNGISLSAHVDMPVDFAWRVRIAAGTMWWTADHNPRASGSRGGRGSLAHVAVSAVHDVWTPTIDLPLGIYSGIGLGGYRYHIEHGGRYRRYTPGLLGIGGMEWVDRSRRIAVNVEAQVHVLGSAEDPRASTSLLTAKASLSIGISRRF